MPAAELERGIVVMAVLHNSGSGATAASARQAVPFRSLHGTMTALSLTVLTFVLLPLMEWLSQSNAGAVMVRPVDTVAVLSVPAVEEPPPREDASDGARRELPSLQLQEERRALLPVMTALSMDLSPGGLGGDFALSFAVDPRTVVTPSPGPAVFEIEELDAPPRPIIQEKPAYPPTARMRKIEGSVHLEFVVTAEGKVTALKVLAAEPDDIFVATSLRSAQRWRFEPAIKGGAPVAARVRQRLSFRLED